jgi:3-hydroxymyristoyl/3-hydroxydecanoyl-(acyl carrier protein) dehydratase
MLNPNRTPLLLEKKIQDLSSELHLQIPEDLAYLEGHFNGTPIVPGVTQLHWVVEYAKDFFDLPLSIHQGSQIKFMNLMRPLDKLTLSLTLDPEKQVITYKYHHKDVVYSSGKLSYDT